MGYDVYGYGRLLFGKGKYDEAYDALVRLNDLDYLKRGGQFGGSDTERPAGATHHPNRWFSWMDADYPSSCKTTTDVLQEVGFMVERLTHEKMVQLFGCGKLDDDGQPSRLNIGKFDFQDGFVDLLPGDEVVSLEYDSKSGQEMYFVMALAPYVRWGALEWRGEDGSEWKWLIRNGRMKESVGSMVFAEPVDMDEPDGWSRVALG